MRRVASFLCAMTCTTCMSCLQIQFFSIDQRGTFFMPFLQFFLSNADKSWLKLFDRNFVKQKVTFLNLIIMFLETDVKNGYFPLNFQLNMELLRFIFLYA